MTSYKNKQALGNRSRAVLIILALLLLQLSAPGSESEALSLSALFYTPVEETVNFWAPLKSLMAATNKHALEFTASLPTEIPAKTYKIVSVTSKKTVSVDRIWPVKGGISSAFGMRRHPVTQRRSFHNGIDIRARQGTNIVCPTDGIVVCAGRAGLLGRLVKVRTPDGKTLYFGHMHKIKCVKGQKVKQGTVVGTVGRSGRATGPHLHFSVLANGRYMDPIKYLAAK